jgi:putative flippase GtrA
MNLFPDDKTLFKQPFKNHHHNFLKFLLIFHNYFCFYNLLNLSERWAEIKKIMQNFSAEKKKTFQQKYKNYFELFYQNEAQISQSF